LRKYVVGVAEAAREGRLEDIDAIQLGHTFKWKIAFHYQSIQTPLIACVYLRKPLLHALGMPASDSATPWSALYRSLSAQRPQGESIVAFSERLWRDWIAHTPCVIKLSEGAIKHGYLAIIFRHQIVPLLQEYFFEDWQRIAWVLNDHRKAKGFQFAVAPAVSPEALFGVRADVPVDAKLWRLDEAAFQRPESYLGILGDGGV
jgi:hypothetical protein